MQALLCLLLTFVFANRAMAQAPPASGVYVNAEKIDETLKHSIENNVVDQPIDAIDVAVPAAHRASVALLHRTKAETSALIHNRVTEIYQIVEGAGTLVLGGTLEKPVAMDLTRLNAGPSLSGTHRAGESRRVGPKDIVIVPAGTAHRFSALDGPITYLVYRFEPLDGRSSFVVRRRSSVAGRSSLV